MQRQATTARQPLATAGAAVAPAQRFRPDELQHLLFVLDAIGVAMQIALAPRPGLAEAPPRPAPPGRHRRPVATVPAAARML